MESKTEKRQYNFEIRAEDTENGSIIVGKPIVFESVTDLGYFDEVIHKGALDNCDLGDVRFLVNHDINKLPLARCKKGVKNSTMRLNIVEDGMQIEVTLDTQNNTEARNLYSSVNRGDITGMSFWFTVNKDKEKWESLESEHPKRHIHEISKIMEVSAVTFPAYEETEINVRSLENILKEKRSISEQDNKENTESELELEKLKATYLFKL